jgi:hypothetical protein
MVRMVYRVRFFDFGYAVPHFQRGIYEKGQTPLFD